MNPHCFIPDWPAPLHVKALQTTRLGGVSLAPYDSFNLGSHVHDDPQAVAQNRSLLDLPSEPAWLTQVHGIQVAVNGHGNLAAPDREIRHARFPLPTPPPQEGEGEYEALREFHSNASGPQEADACIARQAAAVCAVLTADCLPVLLCDVAGSVVGAAHAGWKGLAGGVLESTVLAMHVAPQNLIAWLGPAISQEFFEVGSEVRAAFLAVQPEAASAFIPGKPGKWMADIYALARQRLKALGVTQIYGGSHCTYREHQTFFSYRRDGVTGRMATLIWLE